MYQYPLHVEFEDIDSYGIIHHPKILYFLERARVHFLHDNGVDIAHNPCGLVLRNIQIQFKAQIVMFDQLIIEVRTKDIDTYRFTFDYLIKKDDKVMISSQIEMVTINLETKRLIPIPQEIGEILHKIELPHE